jgi:hypothetical protein
MPYLTGLTVIERSIKGTSFGFDFWLGSIDDPNSLSNAPENPNLNETQKQRSTFRSKVGWGCKARRLNEAKIFDFVNFCTTKNQLFTDSILRCKESTKE